MSSTARESLNSDEFGLKGRSRTESCITSGRFLSPWKLIPEKKKKIDTSNIYEERVLFWGQKLMIISAIFAFLGLSESFIEIYRLVSGCSGCLSSLYLAIVFFLNTSEYNELQVLGRKVCSNQFITLLGFIHSTTSLCLALYSWKTAKALRSYLADQLISVAKFLLIVQFFSLICGILIDNSKLNQIWSQSLNSLEAADSGFLIYTAFSVFGSIAIWTAFWGICYQYLMYTRRVVVLYQYSLPGKSAIDLARILSQPIRKKSLNQEIEMVQF